jgi:hypothetical protein
MFNPAFLLASLLWGSIGFGYFVYGKKQRSWPPMTGGIAMMGISYFTGPLVMSLLSLGIIAGVYYLMKEGY